MADVTFMKNGLPYSRGTGVLILRTGSKNLPELLVGRCNGICPISWHVPHGPLPQGWRHQRNALARTKEGTGLDPDELACLGMTPTRTRYQLEAPDPHGFWGEERRWVVFRYTSKVPMPDIWRATTKVFNGLLWAPPMWLPQNTEAHAAAPYDIAIPEAVAMLRACA